MDVSEGVDTVPDMRNEQLTGRHRVSAPAAVGTAAVFPDLPDDVAARIGRSMESARSDGTRRAYESAWRRFEQWSAAYDHSPLPAHPATVAAYLVAAADTLTIDGSRAYTPPTFAKWVAAIADRHRRTGHESPTSHEIVRGTLAGIRRDYAAAGDRPRNPRAPLLTADITTITAAARDSVAGWADEVLERRDSALILIGYAGAFRRSELVELRCGDVTLDRLDGVHVRLRRSKTDQDGTGTVRALPFTARHEQCPPCAWARWVQVVAAFDTDGRVGVIRTLSKAGPFDGHVCRGSLRRMSVQAPLFRSIRKNGNLSDTPLSGAAVHATIRGAPPRPDTTPLWSHSWVGIRCGPGSSHRPSATVPTLMPSCARPGTPPPPWSRCTRGRTRP